MQAVLFGNARAVALLQEKGAQPFAESDAGWTAMLWGNWIAADRITRHLKVWGAVR